MNRFSCGILAVAQLAWPWLAVAQTGPRLDARQEGRVTPANINQPSVPVDDGSSPAITISSHNLDFGAVPVDSNNELSFIIQNVGVKILSGTAHVSPPFRILGSNDFVLKPTQTQVITVQYAPKSTGIQMTVVHLTGASVTVVGSAAPRKTPVRRHRAPTQPEGQRLLARR